MEEKDRKLEERNEHTKLRWETPKLYELDKVKTNGGPENYTTEDLLGS